MIYDYRWNPAMGLWVVVLTRTNQIISIHWTVSDAKNLIRSLEVGQEHSA
jgi:hypothetical protein